jgi:hypothetical protein
LLEAKASFGLRNLLEEGNIALKRVNSLGQISCFLIFGVIATLIWSQFDNVRFTRFDGPIKRGVRIGSEPISLELHQFLEKLSAPIRYDRSFIRKEGREVLIAEEKPLWIILGGENLWTYIAYVNLDTLERRVEFRLTWVTLTFVALVIPCILIYFLGSLESLGNVFGSYTLCFVLIVIAFLAFGIGSIFLHYKAIRLLKFPWFGGQ